MRNYYKLILLILLALYTSHVTAQERIYSLNLKQREIEESIRKSLDPFLDRKDYVIKVKIRGTDKLEPSQQKTVGQIQTGGEALPGFELEDLSVMPKITDIIGNTYWQIKNVQVDLVMHKEIPPSVDSFIRQTIPVIAELESKRGDKFNFIPIIPSSIGDDPKDLTSKSWLVSERNRALGLTPQTWIYLILLLALALVAVILFLRMRKMKKNLSAMEEAIEVESGIEESRQHQDLIDEMKKEKVQRLEKQEKQVKDSLLREEIDTMTQKIITLLVGRKEWGRELLSDLDNDITKMAHFVAILGPATARKLLSKSLGAQNYLDIEKESENIELDSTKDREILNEIHKILFAKELSSPERSILDPFAFLKDMTAGQVNMLIKEEPAKIKALVLSRINSAVAAGAIANLSKEQRGQVVLQLGKISDLPLELLEQVAYDLADKAKFIPDDKSLEFDGINMVVNLMSEAKADIRKDIINNLRVSDRNLSNQVESRFFLFESIPVVPNDILTQVARSFPADDVMIAITKSTKELQEKVIMCFPEKIRRTLVSSLKSKTPSIEEVKEKQQMIVVAMQKLAGDNKVNLIQIHADWEKASSASQKAS
ncbi:MAG: hypothetical protein OEY59_01245 [Deltaproteobacteria bacterium]|nr:hypothetical protein [Deltaproteobacteria bacterium]